MRNITKNERRKRLIAQTASWAKGRPYHESVLDMCCPDFSCCVANLFEQNAEKRWLTYSKFLVDIDD